MAYWAAATIGVAFLFLGILVLGSLVESGPVPFHRIWAVLFVVVGVVSIILARHRPLVLWYRMLRPQYEGVRKDEVAADAFFALVLGIGLILAGVAYFITGLGWALLLGFGIPVLIRVVTRSRYEP